MRKSMYSLMLMDSVVAEIDKLALRQSTSRSNLVNQILAEYASLMTPEKRVSNIFSYIEQILESTELIPDIAPNRMTMSLKSSLEYKYRPTIRYEVRLQREPGGDIGELTVVFRTQSEVLLGAMTEFFRIWKQLEEAYISKLFPASGERYALYDGKFVRKISVPRDRDYSNEQLGDAISSYIQMFDALMKGYLNKKYTPQELESKYVSYLNKGIGII